jgi:hypothetical protein
MRLHKYFAIATCCIIVSCSSGPGSDVIPADKMEDILTDMHYADTYSVMVHDSLNAQGNKNKDSLALYYRSILQHHNVSVEDFNESVKWYKINPEQLDSVYAAIIPKISKMETTYPNK